MDSDPFVVFGGMSFHFWILKKDGLAFYGLLIQWMENPKAKNNKSAQLWSEFFDTLENLSTGIWENLSLKLS